MLERAPQFQLNNSQCWDSLELGCDIAYREPSGEGS